MQLRIDPERRRLRQRADPTTHAAIEQVQGRREPAWFAPEQLFEQLTQDVFVWESAVARREVERYLVAAGRGEEFLEELERTSQTYIAFELKGLEKRAGGDFGPRRPDESLRALRLRCDALAAATESLGEDALMSLLYDVVAPWMTVTFDADALDPDVERAVLAACNEGRS